MAGAYKCDVCGKLYEGHPGTLPVDDVKGVALITLTARIGKNNVDICSDCCFSFAQKFVHKIDKENFEKYGR